MILPNDVLLIDKNRSPLMRALGLVLGRTFMARMWTTYRLPFQRCVRITHPVGLFSPASCDGILEHELVHVAQFRRWWAPWLLPLFVSLLPLPVIFSGRWFVERPAYLCDIRNGRLTLEGVVQLLWSKYGAPWPRPLMRRWFERQLAKPPRPR
jgi:hypothetical protein